MTDDPITAYHGSPHAMEEDYRGQHQAPDRENGVPLHDTSGVYPPDFYGPNGFRYYADHGNDYDYRSYNAHVRLKDKPEEFVSVHRAIPSDVYKKALKEDAPLRHMIRPGDWVTPSKEYAKEHGEAQFGKNYKIASMRVKAKDVFTNGDSIHEWGYDPEIKKEDGGGITAYHGSPHDFDQFDTSKIGTGEGAQAYGHGLYFAEHEPVAKGYRDALSANQPTPIKVGEERHYPYSPMQRIVAEHKGDVDAVLKKMMPRWEKIAETHRNLSPDTENLERYLVEDEHNEAQKQRAEVESMRGKTVEYGPKGHMYEVHIDAHPDHMLDWDKDVSEQHPHILDAINKLIPKDEEHRGGLREFVENPDDYAGGAIIDYLHSAYGAKKTSEMLHGAGIKGIKYLDAGSRSDESKQTHNYVIFDHNRVKVKRKYEQGGDVEAYGDGGNVGSKINNPMSVFPKPQRMFPEDAPVAGGQYLSMPDKQDMTGHKSAAASIGVNPGGKPYFTASRDEVDETGSPGRGSATAKTNLFKQKAGWKWKDAPEGHEDTNTIVSVEHRGQHHYALNAHFPKGVDFARYENSPSEPRLRPTTRGNVEFGPQAGSILVRGREHPVYHHVIVKNAGGEVEGSIWHEKHAFADGGDPRGEGEARGFGRETGPVEREAEAPDNRQMGPEGISRPESEAERLSNAGQIPDWAGHYNDYGAQRAMQEANLAPVMRENARINALANAAEANQSAEGAAQNAMITAFGPVGETTRFGEHPLQAGSFKPERFESTLEQNLVEPAFTPAPTDVRFSQFDPRSNNIFSTPGANPTKQHFESTLEQNLVEPAFDQPMLTEEPSNPFAAISSRYNTAAQTGIRSMQGAPNQNAGWSTPGSADAMGAIHLGGTPNTGAIQFTPPNADVSQATPGPFNVTQPAFPHTPTPTTANAAPQQPVAPQQPIAAPQPATMPTGANVPLPPLNPASYEPSNPLGIGLNAIAGIFGGSQQQLIDKFNQKNLDAGMSPTAAYNKAQYDMLGVQNQPRSENNLGGHGTRKVMKLMPDGTYKEVEEPYAAGGKVKKTRKVAKSPRSLHNSKIVKHALGKIHAPLSALNHPPRQR